MIYIEGNRRLWAVCATLERYPLQPITATYLPRRKGFPYIVGGVHAVEWLRPLVSCCIGRLHTKRHFITSIGEFFQ